MGFRRLEIWAQTVTRISLTACYNYCNENESRLSFAAFVLLVFFLGGGGFTKAD